MYTTEVPEDLEKYLELSVDGRSFYRLKKKEDKCMNESTRRRRYSDRFKDPLFVEMDIHKKLKMMKQFHERNKDLENLTNKWRDCVSECTSILCSEYGVSSADIFRLFNLGKYGFHAEDYNIYEENRDSEDLQCNT